MQNPFRIVFALFPDHTQLDFTGPFEVLQRLPGAEITIASRLGGELRADGGLFFTHLKRLSDIEACELICVPGGSDLAGALADRAYLAEVRRLGLGARYVTSVCTGSLILAAAGLIAGKRAACHWAYRDLLALADAIPDAGRVVKDGAVISGGGVTAGIDFALALVAEIAGETTAQAIQLTLEYDPQPPFAAGRPEQVSATVLEQVRQKSADLYLRRRAALAEALRQPHA